MSQPKRIVSQVSQLAEGLLGEYGMEMVDVEFRFERGRWTLRVFIDKQGGITVDDCAHVNRELGDLIEAKDIIGYHYVLEISSPGLNRPLRKEGDFIRSIGKMVKLELSRPINKRRNFTGRVTSVRQGIIGLLVDNDNLIELPLKEIDRARVKYEFNN